MDSRYRRNESNLYTAEQVRRVLTGSGIDVESDLSDNYIIFCPFHNNHRTPAGEVHKTSGLFFCFSCQKTADLIELIMHTSGRTYFEAARYIKSKEKLSNLVDDINKSLVVEEEFKQFDVDILKRLYNNLVSTERPKGYFKSRHIETDSWEKFKLGYSEKQDMVTVPVHSPDGIPIGFVGRSIEGKDFKNTPGLPKSKTLFNLHRVKKSDRVYVVESSFDAIRLDQVGLPAVATLGANVSNAQIELLQKYFNNVIVVADNDEAGGNMKDRIVEKLTSRVSVIKLNNEYKDIGDMPDEELKSLEFQFDKSILLMLN
jgi:DNA primase